MRTFLTALLLFVVCSLYSQTIQIGLFNSKHISAYTVSVRQGKYMLICDGQKLGEYKKNSIFYVKRTGQRIELRDKKAQIGLFNKIEIRNIADGDILSLRGVNPSTISREYNESLIFKLIDGRLKAINHIDLERYIAAVIEAEGGINAELEYYKAQAILVRTYTIKSIYKHAEEGFNLCDEVHCQAYHGRSARNPEIYRATKATAGLVLIDQDSVLAMTPFFSSCGGQTSSAGIYWQSDLPYLQSVADPFCLEHKNAHWEKEIPLADWKAFLHSKGIRNTDKYNSYTQSERQKYFSKENNITLRQIREYFHLRSTYFTIQPLENSILIKGKGYGHGIGMCQIGAMEMARVGYSYLDIIHMYFQNVNLTDYREMELNRY